MDPHLRRGGGVHARRTHQVTLSPFSVTAQGAYMHNECGWKFFTNCETS